MPINDLLVWSALAISLQRLKTHPSVIRYFQAFHTINMDFLGRFKDREEAAKLLSEKLITYKKDNPIVLAIPRGAVPIAAKVAEELDAPMDLVLIKKIGAIHNPELAIGAISEDGHTFFNKELVQILGIN